MALAFVLSVVALLTIVVGSLSAASRSHIALARSQLETARARALADGGVAIALATMAQADPRAIAARTQTMRLPGGVVRIALHDEGGKVDLNAAPPELLGDLFRAGGADRRTADNLADEVADRRELARGITGAGDPPTSKGGSDAAAFFLVDELAQISGMTPQLLDRIAGAATVATGSEMVDPATAPPAAVLALSGLDGGRAERFLRERARIGRQAQLAAPYAGALVGAGYAIEVEGTTENGGRFVRVAVLKPRPFSGRFNLRMIDWRGGEESLP